MKNDFINEESVYYGENNVLTEKSYAIIRDAIRENDAVGFVVGYYDEKLTIANVSEFLLYNLGYSYDEFMQLTEGSLKKLFYGDNQTFLAPERFKYIQGTGEGEILTKFDGPIHARLYKLDTVDVYGTPVWVLSARIDWVQQNLALVNSAIDSGFWYIDCDVEGKLASVTYSHEFRRMLGCHDILDFPNELDSWVNLLHPEDCQKTLDLLFEALADKTNTKKYNAEYRMRMRDGSYQWFRNIGEITRRLDGTACRMAGIFVNIDQEKKDQIQNQAMDQLIRGLVRLVDRYVVCNLNHETYKVYSRLNQDSPYTLQGKYKDFIDGMASYYKLISKEMDMEQVFSPEHIREMLKTPEDVYKLEYCTKDEQQFKALAITPISWKNGQVEKILFISQDTTQGKLLEIASRKALKDAYDAAEQANRAKTEFLSKMSHDIRTPMNAIIGMTAIAGANMDHPVRVRSCLERITQSSKHLLGLINEVLDMSRIESGKITLSEEDFRLPDLIDELLAIVKNNMEMHHHDFEVHLNKVEHEDVCGDSLRVQQVIINILNNAIKYTPDGGRIRLSIAEIPTLSCDVGCYKFTVEDNGIGISDEFQKVLFEPFTRADDQRVARIQGTGLGMTIAQNIAGMMNGSVQVESELNRGSKFTITIFLKLQNKAWEKVDGLTDLSVLVVDDDPINCENTVDVLRDIGIHGEWVTSGECAVERVRERHLQNKEYFTIIIDWKMAGMNGVETAAKIRKIIGRDVSIIILSSYDYSEIESEARNAGVNGFITKPLFRSKLIALLKNLIEGKKNSKEKNYLSSIEECDFKGKRILLVEDNELNREIACEIIGMSGATIETAEDGKAALDKFKASEPGYYHLIFMDIQMPVMNGYEATKAIRRLNRSDSMTIPIVAMTANAFAEDVAMAKKSGMNEHMAKPLEINRLCEVLKKYCG